MADYVGTLARTASTTLSVGVISAAASGPRRLKLYEAEFGSEAAPVDNVFLWLVQRTTTFGTNTGVTPSAIDPADIGATAQFGQNTTVEPTYTAGAVLNRLPLNQRATYRWVAFPGKFLVIPATANNGLGLQTPTSAAVAVSSTLSWEE